MTVTEAPTGREAAVARLFDLFRRDGFEGVSIADVTRATGLGRSSLYHHFPGGKTEMAEAVLAAARQGLGEAVLAPLRRPGPRAARVGAMLDAVARIYGDGEKPCVIASMLVGVREPALSAALAGALRDWLDALTAALTDTGATAESARAAAEDAVARIQGALVLSRGLGDPAAFRRAIAAVARDLAAA